MLDIVEGQNYNGLENLERKNKESLRLAQDTGEKATSVAMGVHGVCDSEENTG